MTGELINTELLIKKILDFSEDPQVLADLNGKIQYANPGFLNAMGLDGQSVIGKSIPDIIDPSDLRSFQKEWSDSLGAATEHQTILKCLTGNGIQKEFIFRWRNLQEQMKVMVKMQDITDRNIPESEKLTKALENLNRELAGANKTEMALTDIQKVLSENVDKFRLISQNMSDLVCLHEPVEAKYLYVSPSVKEVTGYDPEDLVGKSPYDFFHPDVLKALQEDHMRKQQGEDTSPGGDMPPPKTEFLFRAKDGGYRWIESHSKPIFDEEGQVVLILSSSRDITSRKTAELEKEKYDQYYRILSNNIPNGAVFLIDSDFRFLIAEGQEFKKLNRTSAYYTGKTIYEVYTDERLKYLEPYFKKVLSGESVSFDYEYMGFNYIFLGSPSVDQNGKVLCGVFLTQNVTEQKQAEKALKKTVKELENQKAALDVAALVSVTDPNNIITYVNENFSKISGYSRDEMIGKTHDLLNSDQHTPEFMLDLNRHISQGKIWHGEVKQKGKFNSYFWTDTFIVPFLDEKGELTQYVYIRFDITERVLTKLDLEARNIELDSFAYHTSHDLRAPLASILGLTELICTEEDLQSIREYNTYIEDSVKKLDHLIKTVLVHYQSINQNAKLEEVDFNKLVNDCIFDMKYAKDFSRLKIDMKVDCKVPFHSDNFRVSIIVKNMISNAIKYQDPKKEYPRLNIDISSDEKDAVLKFEDNGIGIGTEVSDKIFHMFFRGSELSDGYGLGLYIVKQVVDRLHGQLTFSSEPGVGTTFVVRLPNQKRDN